MERVGVFREEGYTTIGDTYKQPGKSESISHHPTNLHPVLLWRCYSLIAINFSTLIHSLIASITHS